MRWYCTFPCGRVGRCRNIIGDAQPPDRIPGRGALLFRGSFSGGATVASRSTRSHPEHGSQARKMRWYCTVSVWESRSLPEYHRDAPPPDPGPRGVAFSRVRFRWCIGRQSIHPFPSRARGCFLGGRQGFRLPWPGMGRFARIILDGVARLRRIDTGLRVFGANGHRYRFSDWYLGWLEDALRSRSAKQT